MTNQVKLHVGYIGKTREGKRVEIVGSDKGVLFFTEIGTDHYENGTRCSFENRPDDIIGPWADDATKYEPNVWHGWNGGECPVGSKSVVDITYADGTVQKDKTAWHMKWDEPLLFRIVTPYVEPEPKLECWVNDYGFGEQRLYNTKEQADKHASPNRIRCVRMIEADDQ